MRNIVETVLCNLIEVIFIYGISIHGRKAKYANLGNLISDILSGFVIWVSLGCYIINIYEKLFLH